MSSQYYGGKTEIAKANGRGTRNEEGVGEYYPFSLLEGWERIGGRKKWGCNGRLRANPEDPGCLPWLCFSICSHFFKGGSLQAFIWGLKSDLILWEYVKAFLIHLCLDVHHIPHSLNPEVQSHWWPLTHPCSVFPIPPLLPYGNPRAQGPRVYPGYGAHPGSRSKDSLLYPAPWPPNWASTCCLFHSLPSCCA